ncbi:hypothetical protein Tco_0979212 [Tanacetum coccineum]
MRDRTKNEKNEKNEKSSKSILMTLNYVCDVFHYEIPLAIDNKENDAYECPDMKMTRWMTRETRRRSERDQKEV